MPADLSAALRCYLRGSGQLEQCRTGADFAALVEALEGEQAARLRWRVERALGLSPRQARRLRRGDYLYCLAQLELDRREALERLCPACRAQAETARCPHCGTPLPEYNPGFDEARYEELKRHGQGASSAL